MGVTSSLVRWFEGLDIYQGPLRGQRMRVLPWQRELLALFDSPGDIAMTLARKNGKSTWAGGLAAAGIAGPLAQPFGEVCVIAPTFKQTQQILRAVKVHLADELKDRKRWQVRDSQNVAEIVDRETGAGLYCLASNNPAALHGRQPVLWILDECAGFDPNRRDQVWSAVRTSGGAFGDDTRVVLIGTRPDDPEHFFERQLKGERAIRYAAEPEDDPFDPATWAKANPAIDDIPGLRAIIERHAAAAKADALELPSFKALRCNMGTSDVVRALLSPLEDYRAV